MNTHTMFSWKIEENYPVIITKYSLLTIPLLPMTTNLNSSDFIFFVLFDFDQIFTKA